MTEWHLLDVNDVLNRLDVNPKIGLNDDQVTQQRVKFGANELVEQGKRHPLTIIWEQVREIMVLVLIAATVVSALLGEWLDAGVILAIVVINTILGFVQEYKAEQAMAALKKMAAPAVKVKRNGKNIIIPAQEIVVGDIVAIEAGDKIPADCRLIKSFSLRVEEASLTGESEPINKIIGTLSGKNIPIGDKLNSLFMGTAATYGRGEAVVVNTGMDTEIGHIADLIQNVEAAETPLQRRMAELGKILAWAALGIIILVLVLGLLRGEDPVELFLTAVAMAVAAIPEGLPAVVTISLALGAQRMLKRDTLIRKLPAVETLGSVTTICSDKTGTLTQNKMTVKILDMAGVTEELIEKRVGDHVAYHIVGDLPPTDSVALSLMLVSGALCNDARLERDDQGADTYQAIGDPTEGALLVAAAKHNLWKADIDKLFPRVGEVPFSSERKRMTTVHEISRAAMEQIEPRSVNLNFDAPYGVFTKGALDRILNICDEIWVHNKVGPIDDWKDRIWEAHDELAASGFRVLGVAVRFIDDLPSAETIPTVENKLIFVGMVGMVDPARPEVPEAVAICKHAGIRTVMITGDHPLTAKYIAQHLGIAQKGDEVLTGPMLDELDDAALEGVVERVPVYARVSPEHKLKIVSALQRLGHVVAMTGDGVNDAPALRRANIGVAMGITGTEVSKEAADMVILDDNFSTIVHAVEEGRTIYDNVRKFMQYILTSNAGEIYVMLLAPFLGMPLPLIARQILWINLVTDGLPGLALSVEPPEEDTMARAPYAPDESIFSRGIGTRVLWAGLLMGLVSLFVGYAGFTGMIGSAYEVGSAEFTTWWRTLVFTTLTLSQMGNALAVRSNRESLFKIGLRSNKLMLVAVLSTLILQLIVLYVPFMQNIFGTVALSMRDLAVALGLSTVVFWAIELEKWLKRRLGRG